MDKKKIIVTSALLVAIVVLVAGISYSIFTYTSNSEFNTIDLGRISMSYTEPSNAYVLDNALPMNDDEGKVQSKYFEFIVTSHATTNESDSVGVRIPYEISISDITIDEGMVALPKSAIKVSLAMVDGTVETEVVSPTLISNLATGVVYQTEDVHRQGSTAIANKYRLRAWISSDFDMSTTQDTYQYKFRVNVNSNMPALDVPKPLAEAILDQGVVTSGNGLYMSTETNDDKPTYYYKGNVTNNCISFADKVWKIIRINEDGTTRIILNDGINDNATYNFSPSKTSYRNAYYSETNVEGGAKKELLNWYNTNLVSYDSMIATSTFCEQAKVTGISNATSFNNVTLALNTNYTPNFECKNDANGYGLILDQKIGLITIDEFLHANGNTSSRPEDHYLINIGGWMMSPGGINSNGAFVWLSLKTYGLSPLNVGSGVKGNLHPVISLNADVTVNDAPFVSCPVMNLE